MEIHTTAAGNPAVIVVSGSILLIVFLGSVLPDVELLCKSSENARPDLFVFFVLEDH